MKKDMIFAPVLLVIGIALFMLRATGMTAHIVVSVLGIVVLAAYTIATKKEWKIIPLEVGMRACYGIALISGAVMMKVHGIAAMAIVHKVCAALFVISLIVLFVKKMCAKKDNI